MVLTFCMNNLTRSVDSSDLQEWGRSNTVATMHRSNELIPAVICTSGLTPWNSRVCTISYRYLLIWKLWAMNFEVFIDDGTLFDDLLCGNFAFEDHCISEETEGHPLRADIHVHHIRVFVGPWSLRTHSQIVATSWNTTADGKVRLDQFLFTYLLVEINSPTLLLDVGFSQI